MQKKNKISLPYFHWPREVAYSTTFPYVCSFYREVFIFAFLVLPKLADVVGALVDGKLARSDLIESGRIAGVLEICAVVVGALSTSFRNCKKRKQLLELSSTMVSIQLKVFFCSAKLYSSVALKALQQPLSMPCLFVLQYGYKLQRGQNMMCAK